MSIFPLSPIAGSSFGKKDLTWLVQRTEEVALWGRIPFQVWCLSCREKWSLELLKISPFSSYWSFVQIVNVKMLQFCQIQFFNKFSFIRSTQKLKGIYWRKWNRFVFEFFFVNENLKIRVWNQQWVVGVYYCMPLLSHQC